MYVIPAEGLMVPDLVRRDYLPPEGREVEPSEYWTRRLIEEGVTMGTPPAASAAAPQSSTSDPQE